MKKDIQEYHLHKDDINKLHFEIKDSRSHLKKYPNSVYRAHRHTFYQFIWFRTSGRHFVDYKEYQHPTNSFFLLNKNQVHYFNKDAPNDGVLYHFDEIFINRGNEDYRRRIEFQLFNEVGLPYVRLDEKTGQRLDYLTGMIQREINDRPHNYREMIFSLMQAFIVIIERLKHEQTGSSYKKSENLEIAINFKRLVLQNMDKFISLDEYADELGVSTRKLSEITNEYLSLSPSKYITHRKILEAQRLLSNTSISIKEVAYALGFDQATYFTKYFKKALGVTPKEFISEVLR